MGAGVEGGSPPQAAVNLSNVSDQVGKLLNVLLYILNVVDDAPLPGTYCPDAHYTVTFAQVCKERWVATGKRGESQKLNEIKGYFQAM